MPAVMAKTIVVGGFGPGIATAMAQKFGAEGFTIALVGRSEERLADGVKTLGEKGITATAFPADLGSPAAVKALVGKVRDKLGPISVLHWNAYSNAASDLLVADVAAVHATLDVAVTGLLTAVQEALPDLRQQKGAVLVTNGGLLFNDPNIDERAAAWNLMGLALGNAAKHKLVGMLSKKLKADGVYIGEVIVTGTVKGSAFDKGNGTLEAGKVAQKFWELYSARNEVSAQV